MNRKSLILRWCLAASCALAIGCDTDNGTTTGAVVSTPSDLLEAPTELQVGGATYEIQATLWRDFMPIAPPDGRPLIAVVQLHEANSDAIPAGSQIDRLWVVNGEQAWAPKLDHGEPTAEPAQVLELAAREGPKWGPDIEVDVVVEFTINGVGGYRLLLSKQRIEKTL